MNEELEKITKTDTKIKIGGIEREVRFTFSAWARLEKLYGSMAEVENHLQNDLDTMPMNTIIELCWIGLTDRRVYKDGKPTDVMLEKETLLDEYDMADVKKVTAVVTSAVFRSLPKADGEEESGEAV